MLTNTFNLSKIENTNRATTLKDAVISVKGVSSVSIDVDNLELKVTYNPSSTNFSAIRDKITDSGFDVY